MTTRITGRSAYNTEVGSHCLRDACAREGVLPWGSALRVGMLTLQACCMGLTEAAHSSLGKDPAIIVGIVERAHWVTPEHPPGVRVASVNHLSSENNIKAAVVINTFYFIRNA